nr:iron ABC transporter substrate-binding protein [Rhizobium sp. Q54]
MLKFVALAGSLVLATCVHAHARTVVDDGGREVEIPDTIVRVLPAGPPASVLVYVLSPDKLVSWTHELTDLDRQMLLPQAQMLPVSPRLAVTKGDLDVEALLAIRPDVIVDVGTVDDAYISRANEIQERTGIPYILIDGSLRRTSDSLRQLGAVLNVSPRAEELAQYADRRFADFRDGLAAMGGHRDRRCTMDEDMMASKRPPVAPSMENSLTWWALRTSLQHKKHRGFRR